ncbi:MAG: hypothetical protein V7L20_05075 [Nostoc sp.]|uniref:hypothetical protein n=1 Tax=Nostoc sp. TaxID=1180 RepID=UPI002FFA1D98
MAKQCYLLLFTNCVDVKGHGYYCVESVGTVPGSCGVVQVINGVNTGVGAKELNFIPVAQVGAYPIPPEYSTRYDSGYYGACCDPKQYDCINGACLTSDKYSTPGLYPSLSDCEIACGTGCSGKCISNSDWAQIEGLSGQLKNRNCS